MLWLLSSVKITSCRQVARHGWFGGMWGWKATEKLAGMTKSLVLRTPMADSRRFFAEALPFGPLVGANAAPSQLLVHRQDEDLCSGVVKPPSPELGVQGAEGFK